MTVRAPAVAGIFYPDDPRALRREVGSLLAAAAPSAGPPPKALIVPHAGYRYSGAVAASAYRALEPQRSTLTRIVLLGPAHTVMLHGVALPGVARFASPLGEIPVDGAWAERIVRHPAVTVSPAAHRREHCLEVQLPFLTVMLGPVFEIVPLVVGRAAPEVVGDIVDRLWGGPETLILVSSDLSHGYTCGEARRRDEETHGKILAGARNLTGGEACGAAAINGLMTAAHGRGLEIAATACANSADAGGPRTSVVGYGAYLLYAPRAVSAAPADP